LRRIYRVKEGDIILNHVASGGVGLILGPWAKHIGATVIGTVGTDDKAKLTKTKGRCKHVINYRTENFVGQVSKIKKVEKCHVVYDGVGKDTFMSSLDCVRPLGMLVSFGNASGLVDPINPSILGPKGSLFLTRPSYFTYFAKCEELVKGARELFKVIEDKVIKIQPPTKAALIDSADVHRALEGRKTTGATVLIP
jgi:NADPH2:quinone reductase